MTLGKRGDEFLEIVFGVDKGGRAGLVLNPEVVHVRVVAAKGVASGQMRTLGHHFGRDSVLRLVLLDVDVRLKK